MLGDAIGQKKKKKRGTSNIAVVVVTWRYEMFQVSVEMNGSKTRHCLNCEQD
jgi:hypothetical protein|tara:strand:- start:74 stop:229 length:156 start_codon:yes stop_codon:yes gene_type:complete